MFIYTTNEHDVKYFFFKPRHEKIFAGGGNNGHPVWYISFWGTQAVPWTEPTLVTP